jgi:hypothetical protein
MKTLRLLILLTAFATTVFAQIGDSAINVWQVGLNYSFQKPGADMESRYGYNSMVGPSFTLKTKKNWMIGAELSYLFGSNIKDGTSMLDALKTNNEQIINEYGEYGTILLTERGFYTGAYVGKLFPVLGPNQNSGVFFNLGAGLLQHHIRIENKDNNTPPVLGEYKKGYDKLSNGLCLRQFIGYQYLSNRRTINFYFGIEFYQGFTQSRRSFDFDTRTQDTQKYLDLLYAIKAGWILPLYRQTPDKFYYY